METVLLKKGQSPFSVHLLMQEDRNSFNTNKRK